MKNFKKFLEEISIEGNPGVPGENGKQVGDSDYLKNIELRAKERLNIEGESEQNGDMWKYIHKLMGELVPVVHRMSRGKEAELEALATAAILDQYGEILDGVELDIKFGNPGENFKKTQEEEEEEEEMPEPPKFNEITNKDLLDKIHRAKIYNNIIQGEAINTKTMFHSEFLRNGIIDIFGPVDGPIYINTLGEISETASKLDWLATEGPKAAAMEQTKESGMGFAGSVKVEWKPKKDKASDENEAEEVVAEEEIDYAETDEITPIIRVRAIDFSMLLHEAVKGIYELIAAVSVPEIGADPKDIEDFQTVKVNVSSMLDEVADFKTGPEIAADFRDFINENPKSEKVKNIRAFVFGKLCDPNYMTAGEFLEFFRGVLNNTPSARKKMDKIIDEIIDELNDYDNDINSDSDNDIHDSVYDLMNTEPTQTNAPNEEESDTDVDYSKLSKSAIQDLVDDALDSGNIDLLKKLEPFMEKNTYKMYQNEIKMITERLINIKNK